METTRLTLVALKVIVSVGEGAEKIVYVSNQVVLIVGTDRGWVCDERIRGIWVGEYPRTARIRQDLVWAPKGLLTLLMSH